MLKRKVKESLESIRFELFAFNTHRKGTRIARQFHNRNNLKLHLACGEVYKKEWVNIDLNSNSADLHLDLRRPLPFPDNSCDEIYSEHFLEHLAFPDEALHFLSELRRIIKPGKKVTTGVPDTTWPLVSYVEGNNAEYFGIAREKKWHPDHFVTHMEHINFHFRQDGQHLFAYDEETLIHVLEQAGFTSNKKRLFDPEMDSASRQPGSLYVVSEKT